MHINLSKTDNIKTYGDSMEPLLKNNDVLFFRHIPFSKIQTNDIVIIKKKSIYFTHRVIFKTNSYIITKGDANQKADRISTPSEIFGNIYKIKRDNVEYPLDTLYLLQSGTYLREIIILKTKFELQKIKFIFLKGLPLHLFYEKSIPRRIYADCDILIYKNQRDRVISIIQNLGYKPLFKKSNFYHFGNFVEEEFVKVVNSMPVILDLHIEPFSVIGKVGFIDNLYSRSTIKELTRNFFITKRIIMIEGEKFPILSWKNLLLFLSIHFITHGCKGYHRLQFINTIFRKELTSTKKYMEFIQYSDEWFFDSYIYIVFSFLDHFYKTVSTIQLSLIKVNNIVRYRAKVLLKKDISRNENRISRAIDKLITLLLISKEPWFKKICFFLTPAFLYLLYRSIPSFRKRNYFQ